MRFLLFVLALLIAPAAQAERYALSFNGAAFGMLPLGDVNIDFDVTDTRYVANARLQSGGLLALFERTTIAAHSEGRLENGEVVWERYDLDHHYSNKHRVIAMRRTASGIESTITPNYRVWGQPPASEAQRMASRDPLSSIVAMAVHVGRTRRCDGDFPTFDGRFHYRLELRDSRPDRVDSGNFEGPAVRCTMRYVPVAGFEPRDGGGRRNRIPRGTIWFALLDNAQIAPPVRISMPLPLGSAHIALTRFIRPSVEIDAGSAS